MSFFPQDLEAPGSTTGPVVQWEESACLLCGGRNWMPLVEAPDSAPGGSGLWFVVVQCQECGLCFTNPRPSPETIGQFYPPIYRPHQTRKTRRPRRESRWLRKKLSRGKERSALSWSGQGRLLDFGCGGGAFLSEMGRQGWQVTGLDISPAAVQRIRTELRLPALVGSLPHPELQAETFDVITMWHSLEHAHQPLEIVRQARRLLVRGGRLVVAVPNIDSLPFRWFGSSWYGLDLPRHLSHFAPWTLQLLLQRAGFQVGPIRMVRHNTWMKSSAELACHSGHPPRWRRWLKAKPACRVATWYSYLTRQCDCMMVTAIR